LTSLSEATTVTAALAGHAVIRAGVEELRALRQNPGPPLGEPLAAAFLKHADDQTVVGLNAVLRAIHTHNLAHTDFSRWSVLAAPRYLARAILAQALKRFAQEGAWGVSPHLIPHRSLHSVSGTVSQALNIHGPNFGVGGGPGSAGKALLAAATQLVGDQLPGVWVIMTGWNWEPGLDHKVEHGEPATCSAAALALTRCDSIPGDSRSPLAKRLHICSASVAGADEPGEPSFTLESFCDALEQPDAVTTSWRLDCGGRMELEKIGTHAEKRS
jgi:hypothetical protein